MASCSVDPDEIRAAKRRLRRRQRRIVPALEHTDRRSEALANARAVLEFVEGRGRLELTAFVALDHELDTRPLLRRLWAADRPVWLPRIAAPRHLDWYAVSDPDQLVPGSFGIMEPDPDRMRPGVPPSSAVALVPGLGFTPAGARLGHGGGFFDAFLSEGGRQAVGWCSRHQLLDSLPEDDHDRRVDLLCHGGALHPCSQRDAPSATYGAGPP